MEAHNEPHSSSVVSSIKEGQAEICVTSKSVFYNPVQEFNRDLSVAVLSVFIDNYKEEEQERILEKKLEGVEEEKINILEALSATGLRSIRYAKEVPKINKIIANDISEWAAKTIKENVEFNGVGDIVETSQSDACALMHAHKQRNKRFTAVDLDPYGCPAQFLDAAVQCVRDGGLMLVTATDMAVMTGNAPASCYAKYGSMSLRTKACHEMALRILLQCIEQHANRYGRYIVPLLSISADFYIRVFVRIFTGAMHCKNTPSKVSMVYQCVGCGTLTLQPLGKLKQHPRYNDPTKTKLVPATAPPVEQLCEHCNQKHILGGPIWSAPIHDIYFVRRVLYFVESNSTSFRTAKRMTGILYMVNEELQNVPLYWTLDRLCNAVHLQSVRIMQIRSAIMNGGYEVSYSHASKLSIKTDAPARYVWDVIRALEKEYPVNPAHKALDKVTKYILSQDMETEVDLTERPDANPDSRRFGHLRFQDNPMPFWGPGSRSAINTCEGMAKSIKNQNKKKRRMLLPLDNEEQSRKKFHLGMEDDEDDSSDSSEMESDNDMVKPEDDDDSDDSDVAGPEVNDDTNNDSKKPEVNDKVDDSNM